MKFMKFMKIKKYTVLFILSNCPLFGVEPNQDPTAGDSVDQISSSGLKKLNNSVDQISSFLGIYNKYNAGYTTTLKEKIDAIKNLESGLSTIPTNTINFPTESPAATALNKIKDFCKDKMPELVQKMTYLAKEYTAEDNLVLSENPSISGILDFLNTCQADNKKGFDSLSKHISKLGGNEESQDEIEFCKQAENKFQEKIDVYMETIKKIVNSSFEAITPEYQVILNSYTHLCKKDAIEK